jgi:colicin import membrane protein
MRTLLCVLVCVFLAGCGWFSSKKEPEPPTAAPAPAKEPEPPRAKDDKAAATPEDALKKAEEALVSAAKAKLAAEEAAKTAAEKKAKDDAAAKAITEAAKAEAAKVVAAAGPNGKPAATAPVPPPPAAKDLKKEVFMEVMAELQKRERESQGLREQEPPTQIEFVPAPLPEPSDADKAEIRKTVDAYMAAICRHDPGLAESFLTVRAAERARLSIAELVATKPSAYKIEDCRVLRDGKDIIALTTHIIEVDGRWYRLAVSYLAVNEAGTWRLNGARPGGPWRLIEPPAKK